MRKLKALDFDLSLLYFRLTNVFSRHSTREPGPATWERGKAEAANFYIAGEAKATTAGAKATRTALQRTL
jgi:hypothetical protein